MAHAGREVALLAVEGQDRAAFLQGQLTQDVLTLAPGDSRPAAGLTSKGKLLYFGQLIAEPDRLLILLEASAAPAALAHLTKYAVFQKAAVRNVSAELCAIGLYGPDASRFEAPDGAMRLSGDGELAGSSLIAAALRPELERRLRDAGSVEVAPETAEILRVEAGRPRLGQDADASHLPDEVGLQASISRTKGCYVGQEVVARLRTYGRVNRRLVGFRFPNGAIPAGTIFSDPGKPDHELGRVTSSVLSPRFGPIGLGIAFREIGDAEALARPGGTGATAVVAPIPFA